MNKKIEKLEEVYFEMKEILREYAITNSLSKAQTEKILVSIDEVVQEKRNSYIKNRR